ncbi:hypothetical protein [Neobacillus cucumis]|uniref:Uncharacterized protein n=1 Tax=Neobacillus cucumis TaxID=1740721 RepID=A0A2N5HBU9_9BACI|nr:hypothetical protein [Neobacillus cucumis]PLS02999.1 hypothetical protein CVD27_17615 [Neobacillus cucumis]
MKTASVVFFLLSALMLLSTFNYLVKLKRPGVYPPKQVLKKRAAGLAGFGAIFLLIALMLSNF